MLSFDSGVKFGSSKRPWDVEGFLWGLWIAIYQNCVGENPFHPSFFLICKQYITHTQTHTHTFEA